MTKPLNDLPQLSGDWFLTDGGLETTLIFHDGLELPQFAAFDLLRRDEGRDALRSYYRTYAAMARDHGVGFVLESATWRASPDWGAKLGYSTPALAAANRQAIGLLAEIRAEFLPQSAPMVISGCMGPRGDGYCPDAVMTAEEAEVYHQWQVDALGEAGVDLVSAFTMTYAEEAIGIARAARSTGIPVVISFTVETDGRLPTGRSLGAAIDEVDGATDGYPAYYMINCAHPTHFEDELQAGEPWLQRLRGLRANASSKSHAELDEAEELDDGNPEQLGRQYRDLMDRLPSLRVLGGCCGTDHRHISAIGKACIPPQ